MDPFYDLLSAPSQSHASPELLEMLGRKAATDFLEKKASLNEAVVKAVSQHPGLGNEHVRRVVEFANNVAFQEMFQNGTDKNVHFPVADPGVVLRDLRDGGSPGSEQGAPLGNMKDYGSAPTMERDSSLDSNGDALQSGFAELGRREDLGGLGGTGEPLSKEASAYSATFAAGEHANPIDDVYDHHTRLVRSKEQLAEAYAEVDAMAKLAAEDLYAAIKNEVMVYDGAGLGGVLGALEKLASPDLVGAILTPFIERLVSDGIPQASLEDSLMKTAGVVVNLNHPLALAFLGYVKTAEEKVKISESIGEINQGLKQTKTFLRSCV